MTELHKKKCIACSGDMPALTEVSIQELNNKIKNWNVVKEDQVFKLTKYFKFENFETSLSFINQVSIIAETEGHHPDLSFGWGHANIIIFTHAVKGLTESDFILAAKIDQINH